MITSRANARIKLAKQLLRRKGRLREERWLVEGIRPLEEALRHRVLPETVFFTAPSVQTERVARFLQEVKNEGTTVAEIDETLMHEISDAQTPQGIVGIVPAPNLHVPVFSLPNPYLLVLDRIQDPGNLGTLCRTALAADVDGVILLPGTVDPGNPKAVRASAGAMFGLNFALMDADRLLTSLQQNNIRLITADLDGEKSIYETNWQSPLALLVGNEASGPSQELTANSDTVVRIPMPGPVESLNVSIATALCLFEGVRSRLTQSGQR